MHKLLSNLVDGFTFTNNTENDYSTFFTFHEKQDIAVHCCRVAKEAKRLALQYGVCLQDAETAGFLHDISRVMPESEYLDIAYELEVDVNKEERILPMLLHQRISKVVAGELFNVKDENILNAIECHTTLRADASKLDLVLFIADKLSWDSADSQPILDGIQKGLEISLEYGAFSYLRYLYNNRNDVKVMHTWAIEAYMDLKNKCVD